MTLAINLIVADKLKHRLYRNIFTFHFPSDSTAELSVLQNTWTWFRWFHISQLYTAFGLATSVHHPKDLFRSCSATLDISADHIWKHKTNIDTRFQYSLETLSNNWGHNRQKLQTKLWEYIICTSAIENVRWEFVQFRLWWSKQCG